MAMLEWHSTIIRLIFPGLDYLAENILRHRVIPVTDDFLPYFLEGEIHHLAEGQVASSGLPEYALWG